jgi:hypothetical protein
MLRLLLPFLVIVAMLSGVTACKSKPTAAMLQAQKVKDFRERQRVEAIKAYKLLIDKYPDSEYAPQAKERLGTLGPMPAATTAPKKK